MVGIALKRGRVRQICGSIRAIESDLDKLGGAFHPLLLRCRKIRGDR